MWGGGRPRPRRPEIGDAASAGLRPRRVRGGRLAGPPRTYGKATRSQAYGAASGQTRPRPTAKDLSRPLTHPPRFGAGLPWGRGMTQHPPTQDPGEPFLSSRVSSSRRAAEWDPDGRVSPVPEASTKTCTQKQGAFSCSWMVRESLASPNSTLQPPRPSLMLELARLNATLGRRSPPRGKGVESGV